MKKEFIIKWMNCASCVSLNQNSVNKLDWINSFSINLATSKANLDYDENKINFEEIKKNIESNWFFVENLSQTSPLKVDEKVTNKLFKKFIFSAIFSLPVFSMMFYEFMIWISYFWVDLIMYFYAILSIIVILYFWYDFHKSAFLALKKLHFNMYSLISLWTLSALIYSSVIMFFPWNDVYFEAWVAITTLMILWKFLESKAKSKAWDAISKLLELQVKKAKVLVNNSIVEKEIDEINVWEIIIVNAWEKIALDGTIISGWAHIDESMLTGESNPVYKELWSECFWSTLNLDWSLKIKVTKTNKNWTLSHIIKMVEKAQSSKAPIEHLADKISWIFVPTIIIVSIITFIIWYFITWNIGSALIPAVAVLVIACPCALWLATPTAIMVWTWVWAKNGILIKNSETLEKTSKFDVIVFDKTWTITNWKPEVTDIINISKTREELLDIAISLSSLSNHPLSKSIANQPHPSSLLLHTTHPHPNTLPQGEGTSNNNLQPLSPIGRKDSGLRAVWESELLKIENFEEIKWKWISWKINWEIVKLWNKKLFSNLDEKTNSQLEDLSMSWKTPIIVWTENEIYWIIWLLDLPKPWVSEIISKLQESNIETIMLTWDTKKTSDFIWKQIWINKIFAEVMPEDKLEVIISLQKEWKKVAFVGDWINDAPALSQADLAIAMWTWSDIAIESSDIVLVKWNLDKVISSIELSKKTLHTIKQNLFWAFLYNSIWIPLAAFGLLNPIFASFAMAMSSVSVISNSLRLKKFK